MYIVVCANFMCIYIRAITLHHIPFRTMQCHVVQHYVDTSLHIFAHERVYMRVCLKVCARVGVCVYIFINLSMPFYTYLPVVVSSCLRTQEPTNTYGMASCSSCSYESHPLVCLYSTLAAQHGYSGYHARTLGILQTTNRKLKGYGSRLHLKVPDSLPFQTTFN